MSDEPKSLDETRSFEETPKVLGKSSKSSDKSQHLLGPHELAELGPPEAVRLPLDLIDPNARNPRRDLPEVDLLAENIRRFSTPQHSGLMQPIIVRRMGERYELLGGHRRLAAFKLLRDVRDPFNPAWRTIPTVVWTISDDDSYLALISNQVHNRNWKPREEAAALERLAAAGLTLKQIGERLSRTESWASKRLRIYADSTLSGFVQSGRLPTSVAEELLTIPDPATKQAYAERAATEGWSLARARGEARALRLDRQIAEVSRRAHELLQLLSVIQIDQLPMGAMENLNLLRRRIQRLAMGGPTLPTIAEAERAAGVNPNATKRRYSTRRRRTTLPSA